MHDLKNHDFRWWIINQKSQFQCRDPRIDQSEKLRNQFLDNLNISRWLFISKNNHFLGLELRKTLESVLEKIRVRPVVEP